MDMNFLNIPPQAQVRTQDTTGPKQTQSQSAFEKKARETATTFEAVFLSQILKSMSMGIKSDGLFGGGQAEEVFQDVLSEEIANQIARNGGIGLSDSVYREILKTQEVGPANAK